MWVFFSISRIRGQPPRLKSHDVTVVPRREMSLAPVEQSTIQLELGAICATIAMVLSAQTMYKHDISFNIYPNLAQEQST
jgi:hypothetical protein